jgi:aquaporin Z
MNDFVAEFLGSLFFIYIILATGSAYAIGAALALVILLTSSISGGHMNPAVTLTMTAAGKLPMSKTLYYIAAQVLGGLAALAIYEMVNLKK